MKRNYIGLSNSFHDSSIAIVNSKGEVVFAEATERYLQTKHAMHMSPDQFIYISQLIKKYVEPGAELVIAHSWSDNTEAIYLEMLKGLNQIRNGAERQGGKLPFYLTRWLSSHKFVAELQLNALQQASKILEYEINQMEEFHGANIIVKKYEHHLAHAATACYTSPFYEACCTILDGFGEKRAYNCYGYKNGKITQLPQVMDDFSYGSLGNYFSSICYICGFGEFTGEEWKVMGLAAYGEFNQKLYDLFKSVLTVEGLNLIQCDKMQMMNFLQQTEPMKRKAGEPVITAADIAYNGQLVFTEILYKYIRNLNKLGISENLIMGGGCCLNSSASGKITEESGFKNLYVFSAPADDGNSIGAALLAYYEDHPNEVRTPGFQTPYLGSEISKDKIELMERFANFKKISHHPEDIHEITAKLLADGKIIGWVQGKAEFGPRALGNRSILADVRNPQIKQIINERVKFREEFRPLAPAILHEYGPDYFENYQESPYMERALKFKEEIKHKVIGIVHKDGTGRLQTVKKEWNERYYNLIKAFNDITGVPLILNTSFNVMGKPIIHTLEDAIAVFFTSGLDALVIDDILIEKE